MKPQEAIVTLAMLAKQLIILMEDPNLKTEEQLMTATSIIAKILDISLRGIDYPKDIFPKPRELYKGVVEVYLNAIQDGAEAGMERIDEEMKSNLH